MMRSILASKLALVLSIITLCGSADAATAHRFKPHHGHLRSGERVAQDHYREGYYPERGYPTQAAGAATHFAVPGWTDAQTSKWLHDASAGSGKY
jgi:hypothetical protein